MHRAEVVDDENPSAGTGVKRHQPGKFELFRNVDVVVRFAGKLEIGRNRIGDCYHVLTHLAVEVLGDLGPVEVIEFDDDSGSRRGRTRQIDRVIVRGVAIALPIGEAVGEVAISEQVIIGHGRYSARKEDNKGESFHKCAHRCKRTLRNQAQSVRWEGENSLEINVAALVGEFLRFFGEALRRARPARRRLFRRRICGRPR